MDCFYSENQSWAICTWDRYSGTTRSEKFLPATKITTFLKNTDYFIPKVIPPTSGIGIFKILFQLFTFLIFIFEVFYGFIFFIYFF